LACFEDDSLRVYEERRAAFKARRDSFIPMLNAMGLTVPVMPDGAFYAWADCRDACQKLGLQGSWALAQHLMQHAHVAVTPGRDFGVHAPENFIRFSTASSLTDLHTAAKRLQHMLEAA
jgi:aspartate/methionine/tyrosine aminotransferase